MDAVTELQASEPRRGSPAGGRIPVACARPDDLLQEAVKGERYGKVYGRGESLCFIAADRSARQQDERITRRKLVRPAPALKLKTTSQIPYPRSDQRHKPGVSADHGSQLRTEHTFDGVVTDAADRLGRHGFNRAEHGSQRCIQQTRSTRPLSHETKDLAA